jgi:myb-related protein
MNLENPIRIRFSPTEDQVLLNLIKVYGTHNWNEVAKHLLNRTPKQCRDRFQTYLSPAKNRHAWSKEEDERLISLVQQNGLRWKDFQ